MKERFASVAKGISQKRLGLAATLSLGPAAIFGGCAGGQQEADMAAPQGVGQTAAPSLTEQSSPTPATPTVSRQEPKIAQPKEQPKPVSLKVGDKVPNFQAKTLDGQPFSLDNYAGRPVIMVFWTPAEQSKVVKNLVEATSGTDVAVVVVVIAGNSAEINTLKKQGEPAAYLNDKEQEIVQMFGVTGATFTAFVGKSGVWEKGTGSTMGNTQQLREDITKLRNGETLLAGK